MELLAHAPDLIAQAELATPELGKPLLPLLRANAQALQTMGEGSAVPMGPNGRMQAQALWRAAAQLGDAGAEQALQALQADPRWAQVQVLGDLARHQVSQTESLTSPEGGDSIAWSMPKTAKETGRQGLDTEDDEDADAKRLTELLAKSDGAEFAASLSSEDLELLGAFKDMPSLQALDTMSPDSTFDAPIATKAGEPTAEHAQPAGATEGAASAADVVAVESEAAAQLPAVFVPEALPKRKPWWKFWAR